MSKTYNIEIKHKDNGSEKTFGIVASSMADALGRLISGKQRVYVETGATKAGKPKLKLEPFITDGNYEVTQAHAPGMTFPEIVGRTV